MRGTAAIFACLFSLHYLSVIDAYTARFTSENGMPGREHEDQHPRKSAGESRTLSASPDKTERQYYYYDDWEQYGGIPNIPHYRSRDEYVDKDLETLPDTGDNGRRETSQRGPEDKHERRSAGESRSLSASPDKTERQYYYYDDWEQYGGIPNIPHYRSRDEYVDKDLETLPDTGDNGRRETSQRSPEDKHERRSAGGRRTLSVSPDKTERKYYYYDDWEQYGGSPTPPSYRDAGTDADTVTDADKNSFSKTLQRLLSPVVDAVRQLWGKLRGKSLEGAGGGDTKRENPRNEPLKKKAMENRNDEDRATTDPGNGIINDSLKYLTELAKKALDFAYKTIDRFDVSHLTEETKKLKEAVLEILKKARDALQKLLDKVRGEKSVDDQSPSSRRVRSAGRRTNARDASESYPTGPKSRKRSKARNSLRRSVKENTSARASDMSELMGLMTEIEECINKMQATNSSHFGVNCIVLPLMRALASSTPGLTMDADSNVRSDTIESPDSLNRLHFPWGNVFLICNGQPVSFVPTVPPRPDQEAGNTTTTTELTLPPTTSSTTEAAQNENEDSDKAVRSDGKYRSKYDNDS